MELKRTGIALLSSLLLSVGTFAQNFALATIALLPLETDQSSGIILLNDLLVTHNDGAGGPMLYEIDPDDGSLTRQITVEDASNVDWEDICVDQQFIYIADFGNNSGDRTDLRIYRVSLQEYAQTIDNTVSVDTIEFSYSDQVSFIPGNQHNFDAEALISFGDSLYIFTKNRVDFQTNIYSLPKTPGVYQAPRVGNIDVQGLISGGEYNSLSQEIMLTGYRSGVPFLLRVSNFTGTDFSNGQIEKSTFQVSGSTQIEAIAAINDQDYFITSETSSDGDATLFRANAVTAPNAAPTVTIDLPADGHTVVEGTNINFTGTASDAEDGDISANIDWNSDQDGDFDTGASVNINNLSVNTHTITASITDNESITTTAQITVTITANTAPTVTITAPADGLSVVEGTNITFTGTATDIEDGTLTSNLSWDSNLDNNIGNGGSFSTTGLSTGTHTITASVTDSHGAPGSDQITVTVTAPNAAPVVTITAPADGWTVLEGTDILFRGTAVDAEDGDIAANLSWDSSIDGLAIGTGGSFNISSLSGGIHTITASVTDNDSETGSANIIVTITANTPPVVTITSPVDGISEGMSTSIDFVATADDAEEGDLSASLSWDSDLDGNIGNGASFSSTILSVGTHIITATALDGGGLEGNDVIIVEITNTPPTVTITEPVDGTTIEEGTDLMFAATAIDTEEGDLSVGLTWIASLDGGIGSGASMSTTALSIGTQSITASVTDGGGLIGNDAISVTVTAPNAAPSGDNNTVTTDEDITYTFTEADFTVNYSDPDSNPFAEIRVTSLETVGSLLLNSNPITLNQVITAVQINASELTFVPVAGQSGSPYDSFDFEVGDGSEFSASSYTLTINVTAANNPPVVTISAPTDGLSVVEGTNITFTGSVTDVEDNNTTLTNNLSWDSNLDNNIGTGGSFSTTGLSIGVHTITASVTDSNGDPGSDNITVTITANNPPVVTISVPTDGLSVIEGTNITFTGSVTDVEDNNTTLTNNLSWDSNLDNNIGTGGSFSTTGLSIGVHTITASVTDSNGDPGSDNITVTITANQVPTATSVSISGTIIEGQTLTGNYTYNDPENNPEGSSIFRWLRNSVAITGAIAQTYTLVIADVGTNIVFEVTPVASVGASPGLTVPSPLVGPIQASNSPPTNIGLSSTTIAENQPAGTTVGNLTTTDPDAGDTHTYSLVSGNGSSDNGSFQIVGNQLRTSVSFNFEDDPTLNIRIQTQDAAGETFQRAFVIEVTDVNDPPTAVDDLNNNTTESTSININVVPNDTDEDGDGTIVPATVSIASNASDGNAVANGDGTVTYTPNNGFTGGDNFTYTVDDNQGATSNQATVVITVGPNSPPVANNDPNNVTDEDNSINIDVVANDTDSDGSIDPSSVNILSDPISGTVVVNNDGTVTYTPNPNVSGNDSFTYEVDDNLGATSNVAQVSITIDPINDPPVANDDSDNTPEDVAVIIDVIANDTDIEGNNTIDPATVNVVANPTSGTASVNNDGTITYTPNPAYSGPDSFTYNVRDNQDALSNTATVTVSVSSVNDPPVAINDTNNTTEEETPITIDVAVNDMDSDGTVDPTTVTIVDNPSNGSLVNNGDGTITYTPNTNFAGSDSFTYTVRDDQGAVSNTALVIVIVTDINDLPVAVDDLNHTTNEDESIVIDLTANDFDPDGSINNATINIAVLPANGGTATPFSNGSIRFDPAPNFNGIDSLRYTVADNLGEISNTALVVITVNDINDPPVAVNDNANTEEDTPIEIDVLLNDTDIDGTLVPSSVIIFSNPGNGTVLVNPSGTLTYTPNIDFIGQTILLIK